MFVLCYMAEDETNEPTKECGLLCLSFSVVSLRVRWLHRDVSGLTFMFVRSLKDAIYGQVWSALQVSSRVLSQSPAAAVYHTKYLT